MKQFRINGTSVLQSASSPNVAPRLITEIQDTDISKLQITDIYSATVINTLIGSGGSNGQYVTVAQFEDTIGNINIILDNILG